MPFPPLNRGGRSCGGQAWTVGPHPPDVRFAPTTTDHWNNEAEPLRVWIDPSDGILTSQQLVEAEKPKAATSTEGRTVGFEVQVPKDASDTIRVPVYALYHLCDDAQGQCRFLRLDVSVQLKVK